MSQNITGVLYTPYQKYLSRKMQEIDNAAEARTTDEGFRACGFYDYTKEELEELRELSAEYWKAVADPAKYYTRGKY